MPRRFPEVVDSGVAGRSSAGSPTTTCRVWPARAVHPVPHDRHAGPSSRSTLARARVAAGVGGDGERRAGSRSPAGRYLVLAATSVPMPRTLDANALRSMNDGQPGDRCRVDSTPSMRGRALTTRCCAAAIHERRSRPLDRKTRRAAMPELGSRGSYGRDRNDATTTTINPAEEPALVQVGSRDRLSRPATRSHQPSRPRVVDVGRTLFVVAVGGSGRDEPVPLVEAQRPYVALERPELQALGALRLRQVDELRSEAAARSRPDRRRAGRSSRLRGPSSRRARRPNRPPRLRASATRRS